jgi:hypothetical protein
VSWSAITGATDYQIKYANELNSETVKATTTGLTDTVPCSSADGELMKVSLQYISGGVPSGYSVAVSMMCADIPATPDVPSVIIKNLDQIVIEWDPPSSDGGSPILGYQVDMREDSEVTFTTVYDGSENPGARQLEVTQYNSASLQVTTYYFVVRAINWIGASADSAELTVILSTETSAIQSLVSGTGIGTIQAYVAATVEVQARDSSGTDLLVGGDIFSLQVSNECEVTSNFE